MTDEPLQRHGAPAPWRMGDVQAAINRRRAKALRLMRCLTPAPGPTRLIDILVD